MSEFLLHYKRPDPITWVYLSSFLTIGLFFVFHRFWSIRNVDVILLILLAPGLLMVQEGRRRHQREMELGVIASVGAEPESKSEVRQASALVPTNQISDVRVTALLLTSMQDTDEEPLATPPEALDERLEQATHDPSIYESQAERSAKQLQRTGFVILFVVEMLILIRLMIDPMMTRRPLLTPNLTVGGLYFISISLFIFIMANVAVSTPRTGVVQGPQLGPGYALMRKLPTIVTRPQIIESRQQSGVREEAVDLQKRSWTILAKVLAITAHLAIVIGIILIANRHFSDMGAGVGCAALYLLLPYTAQFTGRVDHALPAALLLWAILNYRRPMIAGIFSRPSRRTCVLPVVPTSPLVQFLLAAWRPIIRRWCDGNVDRSNVAAVARRNTNVG